MSGMDHAEFVRYMEDNYGVTEEGSKQAANLAVILFTIDQSGNCSGLFKGKRVYVQWGYTDQVQPGDMWICSLKLNPSSDYNYFGTPVKKIDSAFLYGLTKDQIADFSRVLWERYRAVLEPEVEALREGELDGRVEAAVAERTAELQASIDDLNRRLSESRRTIDENAEIIAGQSDEIKRLRERPEVPAPDAPEEAPGEFGPTGVLRVDKDTIGSEFLVYPRYKVYLDSSHTRIVFVPDEHGPVICSEYRIPLKGLDLICPFYGEGPMRNQHSAVTGELTVFLL